MADKTENIKTRLSFDGEAEYKAACKEINSTLKVLNSEMKLVTAEYKDNADSADALRAKQSVLQKTYDEQAKKVKETEAALEKCRKATGDNSEASKKLEAQLNYQKTALVKTEQELKKTADQLETAEKAADSMGEEIEQSGRQAEDAGGRFSKLSGVLGGLGGAMATGVKAIGTAAAAIGTAVVAGLGYAVSQADEVKYYVRYMDDFIILSPDKHQLREWLAEIERFLRERLKLELNPKTAILSAKNGIDFVGYKHRATHKKVRRDSIKRMKKTIRNYQRGDITKERLQKSIASWTGHAGHADSYNLRKKIVTLAAAAEKKGGRRFVNGRKGAA